MVEDADAIVGASQRSGRLFMVGLVLRFWPEYVELQRRLAGGELGRPLSVSTMRLSPPADWNDWMGDPAQSGGVPVDLLIHETFPTATVLSQKGGMPLPVAEMVVNGAHTSPAMAGMVFKRAGVRMSAMWHLVVDHCTIGPVFEEMRTQYDGPVVISQDLTVFNLTADTFEVAVIPHTAAVTTLGHRPAGAKVNIEIDVLAKHVERLVNADNVNTDK